MAEYGANHGLTQFRKFKTCYWCGYNANLATAKSCEVCGRPLKKGVIFFYLSLRKISASRWYGFVCLILLIGGTASVWKLWQEHGSFPALSIFSSQNPPSLGLKTYATMREVPNVPKGIFNYSGALTFAAIANAGMNNAIAQAHPEFRLRYVEALNSNPGSDTAIAMLINGELGFAQSIRPLQDREYVRAKARNIRLEQVPVAIDGVLFYTHPNVDIRGLSIDKIQNIFRGKVRNWKELGGPDLPIVPMSLDPAATSTIKMLLGTQGEDMGDNVRIVRDYTSTIRQVAATPGAISYGAAPIVIGQQTIQPIGVARAGTNQFIFPLQENGQLNTAAFREGSYPVTRRLFVMIRRDGTPEEQAGLAYANLLLSSEGQKIIEKAGLVPLY